MTPPDVQPTGRRNARMRQTVGDMIRSMAVVLAAVVVIMLFAWRPNPEPITVVETAPVIALAGQQAEFGLSAPVNLPAEWRPTSARWESTPKSAGARVLHIGYVTPSSAYAQFSQSTASTASYLDEQTAGGVPSGEAVIGSSTWERRETTDRRSLVLTNGDVVTVVSGTAQWDELEALAGTLVPVTRTG